MKSFVLFLCLFLASQSRADQLAYITKSEADAAVGLISGMKSLVLFCGCCDDDIPVQVKPLKVYARFTNYEEYYEVVIEYINEEGVLTTEAIDLAYVWKKKGKRYTTIGKLLKLEHNPCAQPYDRKKKKGK